MTRAEVYSNIRYNESLVSQYQSTISSLHSRISGLNAQINNWQNQIARLTAQKNKLQSQIKELLVLKNKYAALQDRFANRQASRTSKLTLNFAQRANSFKFLPSYVNGMRALLTGSEYKNAYNGLTTARETIDKKVRQLQNEVDTINREISGLYNRINANQCEIRSAQARINETSSNLSYRRQRLTYWYGQLSAATD